MFKIISFLPIAESNHQHETVVVNYFDVELEVPRHHTCVATDADGQIYSYSNSKLNQDGTSFFVYFLEAINSKNVESELVPCSLLGNCLYDGDWLDSIQSINDILV